MGAALDATTRDTLGFPAATRRSWRDRRGPSRNAALAVRAAPRLLEDPSDRDAGRPQPRPRLNHPDLQPDAFEGIAITASAGGVNALSLLRARLPPKLGAPVVV